MNFTLSDEAQMLQDSLRRLLADHYTPEVRKAVLKDGPSPAIWQALAAMGIIGALFPVDQGGFGGTGFDIALVAEEMGRAGAIDPLIDTGLLGGGLLAAAGRSDMVAAVIAGDMHLALAHGEPLSRYHPHRVATTATRTSGGWQLSGRKSVVVNAPLADHVIVSARTSGSVGEAAGISLFLLAAADLDLTATPLLGGGLASEITLDAQQVDDDALLGPEGQAAAMLETVLARATLATSAEALGLMESARALTADYLRTRTQFGQPIGKFQVLQHRMADMAIEIEQARSAVINLAGHLGTPEQARHLHATKTLIGEAARLVTEETIQMHGGIGMTDEYDLAHLARRLSTVDHRFGDTLYHLERFIALMQAAA